MGNHRDPNILRSITIDLNGSQARIEKFISKENEPAKIRISSPVEISENELVDLLQKAIRAGILSPEFVQNLHSDIEI